ncbi:MAG: hypothetical protein AAB019_00030 [Planctomycetota bacterium]
MTIKILLISLWSISFLLVNVGAKKLANIIIFNKGIIELIKSVIYVPWFYVVIFTYLTCAVLYLMLLKFMPLVAAGPIVLSLGIIILTLTGVVIFKERAFNAAQIIGIIFCLVGILLLQIAAKN